MRLPSRSLTRITGSMAVEADECRGEVEAGGVERWVAPFLRDSMLWPVTFVAIASSVTLGAALILLAFRDRSLFALAGVGVLALVTLELLVRGARRRRLGLGGSALLGWWVLSAAAAAAGIQAGLF